jgi:hypothetical protein
MRGPRRGAAGVRASCSQLPGSHAAGHDVRRGRPPGAASVPPDPAHEGAHRRPGAQLPKFRFILFVNPMSNVEIPNQAHGSGVLSSYSMTVSPAMCARIFISQPVQILP